MGEEKLLKTSWESIDGHENVLHYSRDARARVEQLFDFAEKGHLRF